MGEPSYLPCPSRLLARGRKGRPGALSRGRFRETSHAGGGGFFALGAPASARTVKKEKGGVMRKAIESAVGDEEDEGERIRIGK